jgi:hypothetical protein
MFTQQCEFMAGLKIKKNIRVAVVGGSHADASLLYSVMQSIKNEPRLDLQLVVTGTHLSPEFGGTCKTIVEDGFFIDADVECLLSGNSAVVIDKRTHSWAFDHDAPRLPLAQTKALFARSVCLPGSAALASGAHT